VVCAELKSGAARPRRPRGRGVWLCFAAASVISRIDVSYELCAASEYSCETLVINRFIRWSGCERIGLGPL
jgi:hypothetical protein